MHKQHLLAALNLAEKRRGFCAPNPAVGALIVKDDQVIADGFHWAAGHPHAEIEALQRIHFAGKNATLYVTLEPCSHFGKTPPCVDAIIRSGIQQVYFGFKDPNPVVAGNGQVKLIGAGIPCELISLPEIETFYRAYAFWWQYRRPWVNIKLALSQDNRIAGKNGETVKITGPECQTLTHQWRRRCDALLTTISTIIQDDPQFNVRLPEEIVAKNIYVLDSQCRLPLTAQIFKMAQSITVFHEQHVSLQKQQKLRAQGVNLVDISKNAEGLNLLKVLEYIGQQGVHELWVETGAQCFQSFVKNHLANRVMLYRSSKLLGDQSSSDSLDFTDEHTQNMLLISNYQFGDDRVWEYIRKEEE